MWQFFAALHGFIDANTPKESTKLSESEAEDLFDWIEQESDGPSVLTTQTYWWDEQGAVPAGVVHIIGS
ncbi:hypothetical protein [Flavobacterium sp.]|uniref:hypothetical protein n=1 Tax=Flavobacterium sp. TaxID=239 RepID=UPI003267B612